MELLGVLVPLLIGFVALRWTLYELRLWQRQRRDKRTRDLIARLREEGRSPTAIPPTERRKASRLCGGGRGWIDPAYPTVINLGDRRRSQ